MVIYGNIVVNYQRMFSTKSTISQKIRIAKILKIAFYSGQKHNLATFEGGAVGEEVCMSLTRNNPKRR